VLYKRFCRLPPVAELRGYWALLSTMQGNAVGPAACHCGGPLSMESIHHEASGPDRHAESGGPCRAGAEGVCPATDLHTREFRGEGGIGRVLQEALQRVSQ